MIYKGKTALVTGASSGIGEAIARSLAMRGANLILVARSTAKLEQLAKTLHDDYQVDTHVITADLTDPNAVFSVRQKSDELGLSVDILVNNAGFGSAGAFHEIPADRVHREVALNVAAVADLTRAYLPDMVERGDSAIINVASIAGDQPTPYMAIYGATKAFVTTFSEALWAELQDKGVTVVALCPGPVETGFFDVMGNHEAQAGQRTPVSKVAEIALRAVDRGRFRATTGAVNAVLAAFSRALPRSIVIPMSKRMLSKAKGS